MSSAPLFSVAELTRLAELAALATRASAAAVWLGEAHAGHGLSGAAVEQAVTLGRRLLAGGDRGGIPGGSGAVPFHDVAGAVVGGVIAFDASSAALPAAALRVLEVVAGLVGGRLARIDAEAAARRAAERARDEGAAREREAASAHQAATRGMTADAGARRAALEALRADHARARQIIDTALDAIVATDGDGRVAEWNLHAEALFGWSRDEALGRPLLALIVADGGDERPAGEPAPGAGERPGLKRYLASGRTRELDQRSELRCRRRDGSTFPAEIAVSALSLPGGTAYAAFVRDVSERRRAEAELRHAAERVRAVIAASPIALLLIEDQRVVLRNQAAEALFPGAVDLPALGRALPELADLALQAADGQRGPIAARLGEPGGPARELLLSAAPLGGDGVRQVLVAIADLSERRELERQLLHAQKMEAVGKLAGGVAHDFNNLLVVVNGRAELIAGRALAGSANARDAELIIDTAARAARLTRQLLAFSRRQPFVARELDLAQVVGDMAAMLRSLVGETVDLEVRLAEGGQRVASDPALIEQLALNLVVNARDAMPSGGTVRLATAQLDIAARGERAVSGVPAGRWATLTVTDTGCGMDAATQARAFEPFFTTKAQGSGLGLATVYGIVQQSGGHIRLLSAPGLGTTVTVYLPLAAGDGSAPGRRPAVRAAESHGAAGASPAPPDESTVLVVEDEDPIRELVGEVLSEAGFQVLLAANPAEAVAHVERGDAIHLLLSDLVLPQSGGRELAERLRLLGPGLRVLFMSGHTDPQRDDTPFLSKPFSGPQLIAAVRAALARARSAV